MLSIKDHLLVHRYSYEFFKLSLNFRKNYETSLFFGENKSLRMFVNGALVSPNLFNLYYLITLVRQGLILTAHTDKKLEDYVSFTRANFSPLIKSWCDWCSIVNGYGSFLIEVINDYLARDPDARTMSKLKLFKYKALIHFDYLKIMLPKESYFSNQPPREPADLFPAFEQTNSRLLKKLLKTLTRSYNTFQAVEHRWCPFLHIKRIALAPTASDRYSFYLNCLGYADLMRAGEILAHFKHLKCNQCAEQINHFLGNNSNAVEKDKLALHTEEFFALICKLSRAKPR
ncbi:TPA: hypothetical protein ACPSKE_003009 [Legionella feeleii]